MFEEIKDNSRELIKQQAAEIAELKKQFASFMGDGTKVDFTQVRTGKLKIVDGKIAVGLEPYANGDYSLEVPITPGSTKTEFYYQLRLMDLDTEKITIKKVTLSEMKMQNTNIVAKINNGKVNRKGILVLNPADVNEKVETVGTVTSKKVGDKDIEVLGTVQAEVVKVEIQYVMEFIDKNFPELIGKTVRVDSLALNMFS